MSNVHLVKPSACSLLFLFGLWVSPTAVQAETVQRWPDAFISAPIAQGWLASGEIIGRVADDQRTSQFETRAQIGRVIDKDVTVWLGWVHLANYDPHAPNRRENQIVEQFNWNVATVGSLKSQPGRGWSSGSSKVSIGQRGDGATSSALPYPLATKARRVPPHTPSPSSR